MAGAVFGLHLVVVATPVVLVHDEEGDGGAEGLAIKNAGEDLNVVGFLALGDDFALAWASAIEFGLDLFGGDLKARRAAINYDSDTGAVGFSEGGDAKEGSELAGHACCIMAEAEI